MSPLGGLEPLEGLKISQGGGCFTLCQFCTPHILNQFAWLPMHIANQFWISKIVIYDVFYWFYPEKGSLKFSWILFNKDLNMDCKVSFYRISIKDIFSPFIATNKFWLKNPFCATCSNYCVVFNINKCLDNIFQWLNKTLTGCERCSFWK